MNPRRRCHNPDLALAVVPTPTDARERPNSPCTLVEQNGALRVCQFGASTTNPGKTVALLGDSHAAHWRAALDDVVRLKGWRGLSVTLSGCPFSTATRTLRQPLLSDCKHRNRAVPRWFADHPEIDTVFVSALSGARWRVPAGQDPFAAEVASYIRAWRSLPRSVRHIVVIRDTPKVAAETSRCVEQAIADRRPAGKVCSVPRRAAIDGDSAAAAAMRVESDRVQAIDLNRFFCDRRRCYPVIGGALVHKDEHHLTAVFVGTLGPFLRREVDELMASWDGISAPPA